MFEHAWLEYEVLEEVEKCCSEELANYASE